MENSDNILIREIKNAAFKSGGILVLRHIIGFSINFTGSIILARVLGPEIIGLYFISYTVLMFGRGLIDFGVFAHFVRLPEYPSKEEISIASNLQQILAIIYVVAVIAIAMPVSAIWYGRKDLFLLIASAGIGAYFYSWHAIPLSFLERKFEYNKVGVIEVGEIIAFNVVAVVIGVCLNNDILGLSLGNIFRGITPALLATVLTKFKPSINSVKEKIIQLSKTVYPIFGVNITIYIILLAPTVLVGKIAGVKELGIAQTAYALLTYTMIISNIFQRISFVVFSRLQNNKVEFDRYVNRAIELLSLIYIPIIMGLVSFSPLLIPFLYGNKWKGMERVVLVAGVPMFLTVFTGVLNSALLSKGKYIYVFKQSILYTVIYWLCMFILAFFTGAMAVPISHICALVGSGWILVYVYNKYCGRLRYSFTTILSIVGVLIMFISWYLLHRGFIYIPIVIWLVFGIIVLYNIKKNISLFGAIQ